MPSITPVMRAVYINFSFFRGEVFARVFLYKENTYAFALLFNLSINYK